MVKRTSGVAEGRNSLFFTFFFSFFWSKKTVCDMRGEEKSQEEDCC